MHFKVRETSFSTALPYQAGVGYIKSWYIRPIKCMEVRKLLWGVDLLLLIWVLETESDCQTFREVLLHWGSVFTLTHLSDSLF